MLLTKLMDGTVISVHIYIHIYIYKLSYLVNCLIYKHLE